MKIVFSHQTYALKLTIILGLLLLVLVICAPSSIAQTTTLDNQEEISKEHNKQQEILKKKCIEDICTLRLDDNIAKKLSFSEEESGFSNYTNTLSNLILEIYKQQPDSLSEIYSLVITTQNISCMQNELENLIKECHYKHQSNEIDFHDCIWLGTQNKIKKPECYNEINFKYTEISYYDFFNQLDTITLRHFPSPYYTLFLKGFHEHLENMSLSERLIAQTENILSNHNLDPQARTLIYKIINLISLNCKTLNSKIQNILEYNYDYKQFYSEVDSDIKLE